MVIFLFYEWCYAALAIMLHRKIKRTGSLLLAGALNVMAALVTLKYVLACQASNHILLTKIIHVAMIILPVFALTGLGMIVFKWEKYIKK